MCASQRRMKLFNYYSGLAGGLLGANVTADRRSGAADSSIASAAGAPTLCSVGALGGDAHSDKEFLVLSSLVTRAQARRSESRLLCPCLAPFCATGQEPSERSPSHDL